MKESPVIQIREFVVHEPNLGLHWSFSTLVQALNTQMCMFMFQQLKCDVLTGKFDIVERYANDNDNTKPNSGDENGNQQP